MARVRGTVVAVAVVALMMVMAVGFFAYVLVQYGNLSRARNVSGELIAQRAHEHLVVTADRDSSTTLHITNTGSVPSTVVAVAYRRGGENRLTTILLESPRVVGVLENESLRLGERIDDRVGVITSLGNAFWEE